VGDYTIRKLVLYEKNFGWMNVWELNPEVLGSLWLMASQTWRGESLWLKASMIGKAGCAPFELSTNTIQCCTKRSFFKGVNNRIYDKNCGNTRTFIYLFIYF
jgi:hypothetical protein